MTDLPKKTPNRPLLAVVGGGLAGMAAAMAACRRGWRVELFERSPKLGGRAGSFVDRSTGETIDYCQHVGMGCCTELLDFADRAGVADCFQRVRTLHFLGPTGRQCDFTPCRLLPAPLHLLPGFLRLSYLSLSERWGIARTLAKLVKLDDAQGDVGAWLRRQNQSQQAIERFWSVVLTSALGETVDRASLSAAQKVFRDGFWNSRGASDLVLPKYPLSEIFHDRIGRRLGELGVAVHCGAAVRRIETEGRLARSLLLADGSHRPFDACIVAVAWRQVGRLFAGPLSLWERVRVRAEKEEKPCLLSPSHEALTPGPSPNGRGEMEQIPPHADVDDLEPAAITAVHLWFDRPITSLPHAAVVGRTSQWLFTRDCPNFCVSKNGTVPFTKPPFTKPQYCQVVISASHRLARRPREAWIAEIRGELEALLPAARQAKLLHARAVTHPAAVFSVTPESDRFRPPPQTLLENVFLAGDWTATGWPATMEGAVRSGQKAAELLP